MRFLLKPGWIALTLAVAAFAFACYYLLAPWQFHRGDERSGDNAALVRAVATAPVPRGELVAPGAAPLVSRPDTAGVVAVRWVTPGALRAEAAAAPERFTPWLRIYLAEQSDSLFAS